MTLAHDSGAGSAKVRMALAAHRTTSNRNAFKRMASPVGVLTLIASARGLSAVLWENDNPRRVAIDPGEENLHQPVLLEAEHQLNAYFRGERRVFDLPLDAHGTEFQRRVWAALATIPFGETRAYWQIAKQIGQAQAVRAVGAANGRNPISIVVPCHRVIGTSGKLTGFAGGLEAKALLLALEQTPAQSTLPL